MKKNEVAFPIGDFGINILKSFGLTDADMVCSIDIHIELDSPIVVKIGRLVRDSEMDEFFPLISEYNLTAKENDSK